MELRASRRRLLLDGMDHLAQNLDDLRRLAHVLTSRGVQVRFLREQLVFSGEDSPTATLMLATLSALADFERALAGERHGEGVAVARIRGAYRGRARSLTAEQVHRLRAQAAEGVAKAALAREFGVSRETINAGQCPPIAIARSVNTWSRYS
ncbi:recombinase family protein [Microbacterium sp. NPDC089698]|uniref:recombinase family protein n=1 Tax=Microbacterium sp. NPDC089698 TaxID=3364200 RepID=UPI00380FBB80